MRSFLRIGILFGLFVAVASCGSPPEAELSAAQTALDAAKRAEADVYAADAYSRARNTLTDARSKSEAGKYDEAKSQAVSAKDQADQARSLGEQNKGRIRDEAQAIVNRVSGALAGVQASVGNAPRGKGADDDLDQLRQDLSSADASLNSARSSLGSGKANDALAQAKAAESKLGQVQGAVQTAMKKIENWKVANRPWYDKI